MKEYICPKCNKSFDKKSHFDVHINRKNSCDKFTATDTKSILDEINNLKIKHQKIKEKLEKVEDENKKLKTIIEIGKCTNIKNNNVGTQNNAEVVNIIVLNAYGKEDLSNLTEKQIKNILDKGFQSIPKYIETVHFNDNIPENKNICIKNNRSSVVNIYDGKKWMLKDKQEFLDEIKEKGVDFVEQQIDILDENNKKDKLTLKKIQRFIKWYRERVDDTEDKTILTQIKQDKEKLKELDKRITLMLYNNKDKVDAK